jgi:proline iminopeptidase
VFVGVNGTRLYYTDTGGEIPLIGIHGGMGIDGGTLRVPPILDLANVGVRVIIPDQRGHGQSVSDDQNAFTHAQWVEDIRELAARLNLQQFALLGHSYGGFLALEFAIRWPELLTHLILIGTSAGPRTVQVTNHGSDDALRAHFGERWPGFFVGTDKHWALFETLHFSAGPYNISLERELPRYDVRARVGAVIAPTILVVGAGDWYLPDMEWLARNLPSASLCVIPDAGHLVFLERPQEFTRVVAQFLTGPLRMPASAG